MRHVLGISWWVPVFRGVCSLLFGALALAWPAITLFVLVALFGVYAIAVGVLSLGAGLRWRGREGWWLLCLLGLTSLAAGALCLLYPHVTALVLVLIIGAGALITGIVDLLIAIRLRKEIRNEWTLGLAGIISILFGAFVLISPGAGALALIWVIALQSILTGVLFIFIGLRVRSAERGDLGGLITR